MQKTTIIFIIILSLLLESQILLSQESIRIGASPYPISSFRENDEIIGLDFDIVEAILKEVGITSTKRILKPWKRIIYDLDAGNVDMVVPMVFTEERKRKYNLINPSFVNFILETTPYALEIYPENYRGIDLFFRTDHGISPDCRPLLP